MMAAGTRRLIGTVPAGVLGCAVCGHILLASRYLPVGYGPEEGEHAG